MKNFFLIFSFLIISVVGPSFGQLKGIVKTERGTNYGFVSFSQSTKLSGIGNDKHVDGYVKKVGDGLFTFPVGQNGFYSPFAAESDGVVGAYYNSSPSSAVLPNGSPFSTESKSSDVEAVSEKEYWDIDGDKATKITLSWNQASSVSSLTQNSLLALSIVGWNPSLSKWEIVPARVDEISLFGNSSTFTTGSITTLQKVIPNQYTIYTFARSNSSNIPAAYNGKLESVTCQEIKGWVWDEAYPGESVTVELVANNIVYATRKADIYRADLKAMGLGTGTYGFSFEIPAVLLDGEDKQLSVRVRSTNFILPGSPQSLNCKFGGQLEVANCSEVTGWAWDANSPESALAVNLMEGSRVIATTTANIYREDLKNTGVGSGKYGFRFQIPGDLRDGTTHDLKVQVQKINYILPGSSKLLTCVSSEYQGRFESADCNYITGWVWDKKYPSEAQKVEIMEGNTVIATVTADTYREGLKNAGFGTGKYAFSLAVPAVLKDGKVHQLSLRVQGSSYILTDSPRSLTCAVNAYQGRFESVTCNYAIGWAWDKNNANVAQTVELLDNGTVVATGTANIFRQGLKDQGIGTGNYVYNIAIPASVKDGNSHQLSVRIQGSTYILTDSPRALTCAGNEYQGRFETADCDFITGWVWDKKNPSVAQKVDILDGSAVIATVTADIYREGLKTSGFGTGKYVFKLAVPASMKDGKAHQLSVRVQGTTFTLTDSPRSLTCLAAAYQGRFESVTCNYAIGWAWDKNNANVAQTVELLDNGTVVATGTANIFRQGLKDQGIGTGNYVYNIAIPASVKDGNSHQLSVRIQGSTYILTDSPRALTCAGNEYQGRFETADCDFITGWVWDKKNPSVAQKVDILDGSAVIATVTADIYREGLKTSGFGTGKYVFKLAVPASMKDGKAHQLSVRVQGTTFTLTDSPRSLTCLAAAYQGRFESVTCNYAIGWAWDKNNANVAQTVELLDNGTVVATGTANIFRQGLKDQGIGTGNYVYNIAIPASVKDGNSHQLSVRIQGSTYILTDSPRALTCAGNEYQGRFETADCDFITGWVWDKKNPSVAQKVDILDGSAVIATVTADIYREGLKTSGFGTGKYVFKLAVPASMKDGKAHQLSVRVQGTTFTLTDSPRSLTCLAAAYQGRFESVTCNYAIGWAWDKNNANVAQTVELLDNGTVVATGTANIFRQGLKDKGIGTGNYIYNIAIPASVKDGNSHQLSVRVQGSTYILTDSPRALTCNSSSRLAVVQDSTTLVSTLTKQKLSMVVAPNPTSGISIAELHLEPNRVAVLDVTNMLGQKILSWKIVGVGETYRQEIDLSNQTGGVYIISLKMGLETVSKRIVLIK